MKIYRISEVRRASINGRAVKMFKAFKLIDGAYFFFGQFSAPAKTPAKCLLNFIRDEE